MRPLRILLADNLMIRRYGNLRMGPGRKLACGAVRNDWRLCEFSDRDLARLLAPLGIRALGGRIANSKFLLTAKNFRPDAILLGHCDYLTNATLYRIREALPGVRIAHFNVDPLWQESTRRQLDERRDSCDALFATTAGPVLGDWVRPGNVVAYMPNPSDPSMEHRDNSALGEFRHELFFAGNPRRGDPRWELLAELVPLLCDRVSVDLFGGKTDSDLDFIPACAGARCPPRRHRSIWGADYEDVLASSRMSLNLNRREGDKWYSSDRIAHLMGYGILTFQSSGNGMQRFFSDRETVYFDGVGDLAEKIRRYLDHDGERAAVAAAGRRSYHRLFGGARVLRYMVETMFGEAYGEDYEWADEVYRA